jgi:hypothetical protein
MLHVGVRFIYVYHFTNDIIQILQHRLVNVVAKLNGGILIKKWVQFKLYIQQKHNVFVFYTWA